MPWAAQSSVFQRLAEIAEVSAMTKEERQEYDGALKRYRDTHIWHNNIRTNNIRTDLRVYIKIVLLCYYVLKYVLMLLCLKLCYYVIMS